MRREALLLSIAILAAPGLAQDPPPGGDAAPVTSPAPTAPDAPSRRDAHRDALRRVVHFDFARAPLEDVAAALEQATGVPVRVGEAARRALAARRFRMRYVADRTGLQVLGDLAKAAALDAEVTDDGAVLDTPVELRKLRKRLGIEGGAVRVEAADVAKMLDTKRLTLLAVDRSLDEVLAFLRKETGVRHVKLGAGEGPPVEAPAINARITDEPLRVVLDRVLRPIGWDWLRQGSVILVGPADAIAAQRAAGEAEEPPPPSGE